MQDFILPDIGEGIVECELVEWLIAEGEHIEEDQPVADVMTDKALVQIPAPHAGKVVKLYYAQGESAKVHSPLFAIEPDGEALEQAAGGEDSSVAANQQTVEASQAAVGHAEQSASVVEFPTAQKTMSQPSGKALASPAVRRLAREMEVDIGVVNGSGKDGRVLKEDLLALQQGQFQTAQNATLEAPRSDAGEIRIEPIKGIRAAMAKQMTLSASTIPHFTYGDEVDVTELLAVHAKLKQRAETQGVRLTLMPLFIKALALAVQQYPILNSRISDDGREIHYLPYCHVGMAVDTPHGLMVPNIKHVEQRSIVEIAREVARLTEAARSGRVAPEDLAGSTISISNIGALGGRFATPVINPPEVAIVALGRTQQLPRFDADGNVVARSLLPFSWSGDHRVIDGATMARFSALWQSYLEDPSNLLLDLC